MHEFSICQTIVTAVLKEFGSLKGKRIRLKKVQVAAGQYHRLVPESLTLAYQILTKDTPAEGSALKVRVVPLKIMCKECGWKGLARDFAFICRKCEKTDVEIIAGRELYLESIEVESAKRC